MTDELKDIFANVNQWLHYAESKGTALITYNVAAVAGLLTVLASSLDNNALLLGSGIGALCLSILLLLAAYLPVLKLMVRRVKLKDEDWKKQKNRLNVLYFGDISRLDVGQYYRLLCDRLGMESKKAEGLDLELCRQIVINSEITMIKLRIVRWAGVLSMIGTALGLLSLLSR